jgi:hypothetical protein
LPRRYKVAQEGVYNPGVQGVEQESRTARLFQHRFHRPCTYTPLFNPELDFLPWLHPQSYTKGFGDGDLSFAADGHGCHSHKYVHLDRTNLREAMERAGL